MHSILDKLLKWQVKLLFSTINRKLIKMQLNSSIRIKGSKFKLR